MYRNVITPDIIRKTAPETTILVWDERDTLAYISLDVGPDLSTLVVKAERTRRSSKSFTLNVLQQIEDGRRLKATAAPTV